MNLKTCRYLTLALSLSALIAIPAQAQNYPSRPVRFVVPFVPGGPTDIQGRMLGEKLAQRLGQQVLIDNRGGAGGNIGMELTAKAPPDGYTIVIATVGTWAVNPYLYKMSFDVVKDFAPIIQVSSSPGVLVVHPSVPAKSVKELVALAKARPNQLNYGSSGVGGFGHISGELFTLMTGTKMIHVPYKSSAPSLTDVIAGQIQVLFNNAISTVPFVQAKRVRALATTGAKRLAVLSDLPTIAEAGVAGYENSSWSAVAAPAGTPAPITGRLHKEFAGILADPDIQKRHADVGAQIIGGTPEQFHAYLKAELVKFEKLVKAAGIKAASGG
ncbi:MAG: tripartite tricarboxylate transporter substrate binding protein [Burkholderiales bacterium]|jgi:tripartite-type tricarboxylate transporter receptor subunit TctC|nr:tripartite tricarboxylate transporter substrate binding protein [Burkholderiales bacterium]